ncbi:MAG: hypothetical protein WC689_14230 [Methylocystis sp.]|jgi:hypothetical protein
MFGDEVNVIRYHLPKDFELEAGERVFLERLETPTMNWIRHCDVPEEAKTPELLQSFLQEVLLALGGEAWRAMTERGELLGVSSVHEFVA